MPRITVTETQWKQKEQQLIINSLHDFMRVRMNQQQVAKELNVAPETVCRKLKKMSFTYPELLVIFDQIGATDEERQIYLARPPRGFYK